jgi:hypothetical protein
MDWPQRVISRYEFPGLIRRLILRDNDQVVRLEMRDAEGAGVEGYDGIVDALRATPFVPKGRSLWELGVNNDFRAKANREFRKRTLDPLGEDPSDSTFVFVTPHRWDDKDDWSAGKKESSNWGDVRVHDVDNIMQVLEDSPAVHTWLSELLGKPANSAQSLDRWWSRFSRGRHLRCRYRPSWRVARTRRNSS